MTTLPIRLGIDWQHKHPPLCSLLIVLLLFVVVLLRCGLAVAEQVITASPAITFETADGQTVCNAGSSASQIPGQIDLFVAGGFGPGSLDYCHNPGPGSHSSFLALFRMDWQTHKMVLISYLFKPEKPPAREPAGIWTAYDPYAASYRGKIWVAFECAIPGSTSSCIAPLTPDMRELDLPRLTVVAQGDRRGSASSPVLLNFENNLYMYWIIDPVQNQLAANTLVSRGMRLEEDSYGRLLGAGSGGRPVLTDDPKLTSLVDDVNPSDVTADHVAALTSAIAIGRNILAISSIGGTAGQVCKSTHENSPGCWRMSISIADAPLGDNVFGRRVLNLLSLPANTISYPRIIKDPTGHEFLWGGFDPPKVPGPMTGHPQVPRGVRYIPFEPIKTSAAMLMSR